jgi:hypothetical protein
MSLAVRAPQASPAVGAHAAASHCIEAGGCERSGVEWGPRSAELRRSLRRRLNPERAGGRCLPAVRRHAPADIRPLLAAMRRAELGQLNDAPIETFRSKPAHDQIVQILLAWYAKTVRRRMFIPSPHAVLLLHELWAAEVLASSMTLEQFTQASPERSRLFGRLARAKQIFAARPDLFAKKVSFATKPSLDQQSAYTAVRGATECARKHGIPAFLVSGTFLGQHREGRLLAHDYDVDLGLFAPDPRIGGFLAEISGRMTEAERYLITPEYAAHHPWARDHLGSPILITLECGGAKVDLFFHYRHQGQVYHGSLLNSWRNAEFALTEVELNGIPCLAPADADRYLTENYGEWKSPVTEFDCTADTPNMVPTHTVRSLRILMKKISKRPAGHRYRTHWEGMLSQTYPFVEAAA